MQCSDSALKMKMHWKKRRKNMVMQSMMCLICKYAACAKHSKHKCHKKAISIQMLLHGAYKCINTNMHWGENARSHFLHLKKSVVWGVCAPNLFPVCPSTCLKQKMYLRETPPKSRFTTTGK